MNTEIFVFPNDLDNLTMERLKLSPVPEDWVSKGLCYAERISNISFRKTGQMVFFLDGRKSEICYLASEETGWLDAGVVSPIQMACRYAAKRTRFSRNTVLKTLFD